MRVIRITRRQIPQRRFRLHMHEILVVVYIEGRFKRIHQPPNHHRPNLNPIRVPVVYLQLAALKVPDPQRQPPPRRQWIHPPKTGLPHRPLVHPNSVTRRASFGFTTAKPLIAGRVNTIPGIHGTAIAGLWSRMPLMIPATETTVNTIEPITMPQPEIPRSSFSTDIQIFLVHDTAMKSF